MEPGAGARRPRRRNRRRNRSTRFPACRCRDVAATEVYGGPDAPATPGPEQLLLDSLRATVGAEVVAVVFDELLLHAVANRVAPTASGTSHRALDMTDRMASLLVVFM